MNYLHLDRLSLRTGPPQFVPRLTSIFCILCCCRGWQIRHNRASSYGPSTESLKIVSIIRLKECWQQHSPHSPAAARQRMRPQAKPCRLSAVLCLRGEDDPRALLAASSDWLTCFRAAEPVCSFYKSRTYILFIYIYFVVETAKDNLNMRKKKM